MSNLEYESENLNIPCNPVFELIVDVIVVNELDSVLTVDVLLTNVVDDMPFTVE